MNKITLLINYEYYNRHTKDSEELQPLSFLNSFNANTVLKIIEDILVYVMIRGRRKDKYWNRYQNRYLGKQYFTHIHLTRTSTKYTKVHNYHTGRWLMEVVVWDNFRDWKEGNYKDAKTYNGFIFWDITQLLNKVFEICGEWDKEVFEESLVKCLKPHLNRHDIRSFDELYEKCRKCTDELLNWEKEFRKKIFEKDKEINELFESIEKDWIEDEKEPIQS